MRKINVDLGYAKGFTNTGNPTTNTVSNQLLSFGGATDVKKIRWINVKEGDTIKASVEMRGSGARLEILTATSYNSTESVFASVATDSIYDMKYKSLAYTVPLGSGIKMVGIALSSYGGLISYFYNLKIYHEEKVTQPKIVACGFIRPSDGYIHPSFPSYGIKSAVLGANNVLTITLDDVFKDSNNRALVFGSDGTVISSPSNLKLTVSDVAVVNGELICRAYYTSNGAIVAPTSSNYFNFMAIM